MSLERDAVARRRKCASDAEHPAQRVAQLAVGLGRGLQDLRADAQVVGIVGRRSTHRRRMSAPDCLITSCGATRVAERLRHLAAVLVEHEAVGQHDVDRARGRACRSSRAARNGTSRGAGRSLRDTSRCRARRRPCGGCRRAREVLAGPPARRRGSSRSRTRRRGCRRPSARPRWRARRGSARARPAAYQASAPSCSKASAMRSLTRSSLRIATAPSALLAHEHGDRHAPGALARDHPVGPALDHAGDAVLALRRHPAGRP